MASQGNAVPAWQTDDLAEEWIEEEGEGEGAGEPNPEESQQATQAIQSTINAQGSCNFGTTVVGPEDANEITEQTTQVGTFVVHSDQPSLRLPQTPAPGKKKGAMKDIFSPLQLERLFDPPSPPKASSVETPTPQQRVASSSQLVLSTRPAKPSKLSQVVGASTVAEESEEKGQDGDQKGHGVGTDAPNTAALDQAKATPTCQFTFAVPRSVQRFPARVTFGTPGASCSTPNNNKSYNQHIRKTPFPSSRSQRHTDQQLNPNDSRLRLFQFQYDTYTRDHLSAIVDSFGVSSPSNISNSRQSVGTVLLASLQKQDEDREDPETFSRLRAAKRLKLTPPSEFTPVGTLRSTPQAQRPAVRRDYVGEARSFMQKIRHARGLSLISASDAAEQAPAGVRVFTDTTNTQAPSTRSDSLLPSVASSTSTVTTNNTLASRTSATAYRKQAEDLMAKIKGDPKNVSGKSDTSLASQKSDEEVVKVRERSWAPSPETRPTSPVKKQLENQENEVPEPDRDPPSYAASIALNRGQLHSNPFMKIQRHAAAKPNEQRVLVMPVTIPEEISPIAADRILSPNPTFLVPPPLVRGEKLFPAQLRSTSTVEDLNRLVSSGSTATTTTTLTVGSAGSYVKHAGPPHMVHIAPADLPPIPERMNGMVFDRVLGRWIKERGTSDKTIPRSSTRRSSQGSLPPEGFTESEDPFRDIESLGDGESSHAASPQDGRDVSADTSHSPEENDGTEDMDVVSSDCDSIFDDSEEAHISTFTFDHPPTGDIQVVTGQAEDLSESEGSLGSTVSEDDSEADDSSPAVDEEGQGELYDNFASMSINEEQSELEEGASTAFANVKPEQLCNNPKPAGTVKPQYVAATPCRPHRTVLQPPRSALKSASVTPISRGGRSVSFSDGRKEGKIVGLHAGQKRAGAAGQVSSSVGQPSVSARSKRVMEMLDDLEESLLDDDDRNAGQEYMQAETLPHVPADMQKDTSLIVASPRSFARSQTIRRPGQSSPRRVNTPSRANATFLTECSFGVAHDRLVEVITDVQPFEPYWDSLTTVNLSGKRLDSVARLKEFLPKLDSLNLNDNLLSWLSGIPSTVRTLSVASNALTSLTSFGHLKNLENLDLSYNDVDSLQQLKCLRHLRELRADGNKITKLDGLEDFDGLLKLSLENNQLHEADLNGFQWSRLELLNLSNNRLESVRGLDAAPTLVSLNLDNNFLTSLEQPGGLADQDSIKAWERRTLHKLRILRLSGNRLKHLNVARFPNLRTLYVDNNCLAENKPGQRGQGQRRNFRRLHGLHHLSKLENFSARNQSAPGMRDSGLQVQTGEVRDIKRLYLSGNPSPVLFGTDAQACYNLVYLELAACRLTSLPLEFSSLMPNIRALNLNYNFLETDEIARGLAGLKRLRKLTMVGNRMTGTKALVKMLSVMGQNIEMLDFRMNPCTLGWYLPLLVQDKDNGALLQPSEPTKEKHHAPFPSALPQATKFSTNGAEGSEENSMRRDNAVPSSSSSSSGQDQAADETRHADGALKNNRDRRNHPSQWEALDAQFRRGLPDKAYVGRLAYRGLIMRACPRIAVLDGVRIVEKERRKVEALLKRVLKDADAGSNDGDGLPRAFEQR